MGTLAVGLGVNAAVFALVDAVLLRPLPYVQPDRVVFVWQTLPQHNVFNVEATPADYAAMHQLKSFQAFAFATLEDHTLTGDGDAERVLAARVTASLMPLLGTAPFLGHGFSTTEDDRRAEAVVILGDGIWRRRYGADPTVLGRTIQIDGRPYTVVGIMPATAVLPSPLSGAGDVWLPARMTSEERTNEISHNYTVLARLADGVSVAQASGELSAFASAIASAQPATHQGLGARIVPITEDTVRQIRPALLVLLGGVALLLLVACLNTSTLLLSRAVSRTHDSAIRVALGATRWSVSTEVVSRALSLTAIGASAGIVAAVLSGPLLAGLLFETPSTDPLIFAGVLATLLALTLVAAVVPTHRAISVDPMSALRYD